MGRSRGSRYPSLGRDGLAAVTKAMREGTSLPSRASSGEVLSVYTELFERTFAHLSMMVGAKGAQAIAQRAIKRARVRQPTLGAAAATESSVLLDGVHERSRNPQELQDAFEHLFLMTMDVLASLIGADLLTTVIDKLTAGEDQARP